MRVSLGIHGENLKEAINTYNLMSNKYLFMLQHSLLKLLTDHN